MMTFHGCGSAERESVEESLVSAASLMRSIWEGQRAAESAETHSTWATSAKLRTFSGLTVIPGAILGRDARERWICREEGRRCTSARLAVSVTLRSAPHSHARVSLRTRTRITSDAPRRPATNAHNKGNMSDVVCVIPINTRQPFHLTPPRPSRPLWLLRSSRSSSSSSETGSAGGGGSCGWCGQRDIKMASDRFRIMDSTAREGMRKGEEWCQSRGIRCVRLPAGGVWAARARSD